MSGYLGTLQYTGNATIDSILSEVESAGDAYHHTECWNDKDCDGKTCVEKISATAALAAAELAAMKQRAEDAEAKLKAADEQEPVPSDYVFCPEYDETPSGMVQTGGAYIPANPLEIKEGLSCKLYARPLPAPDLQKRVDEFEASVHIQNELHEQIAMLQVALSSASEENAALTKKLAEADTSVQFWKKSSSEWKLAYVARGGTASDSGAEELTTLLSAARAEGIEEGKKMVRVLADVAKERERQHAKWDGVFDDAKYTALDWHEMIADYNGWARRMACMGSMDKARTRYIQIAALAVAAVEVIDTAAPNHKEE